MSACTAGSAGLKLADGKLALALHDLAGEMLDLRGRGTIDAHEENRADEEDAADQHLLGAGGTVKICVLSVGIIGCPSRSGGLGRDSGLSHEPAVLAQIGGGEGLPRNRESSRGGS